MSKIIKKILNTFKLPIDLIAIFLCIPSALFFYMFRKYGSHKLFYTKKILNFIGVFPIIDHYYEPKFNHNDTRQDFKDIRNLPGIKLNQKKQLEIIENLKFEKELQQLNLEMMSPNYKFNIKNNFFSYGDAEIYYQLIRHYNPKNIIEIGSGQSTLIALEAIKRNQDTGKNKSKITCVEPYENKWLNNLNIELVRSKVENLNIKDFFKLELSDILFIDSSHIINPQGDVLKIYQEIIPNLNSGVIVHVHDIFTPRDYPAEWVIKENKFWNEQYLVETLLSNDNKYEILLLLNYLKNNFFDKIKKRCPYLKKIHEPKSLYFAIK